MVYIKKRTPQASVVIVYVATMLVCLIIFGFAAVTLLDVFVTQPALLKEAEENGGTVTQTEEVTDYSEYAETILFVGAEGNDIRGMALLRVNPQEGSIAIVPVSKYTLSSVDSAQGTVESLYKSGGISYLVSAVENAFGVSCDKYIKITDDGWLELVNYTGGMISYVFPEDLYYKDSDSGELTSFSAGQATRTLFGDDIRRIVTYPLYSNGEQTRVQVIGEIAVALINDAFETNASSMKTNIKNIFNTIYNNSDTNITSKSFNAAREAYEYLLDTAESPATYRMARGNWDSSGYFTVDEEFKDELAVYFGLTASDEN